MKNYRGTRDFTPSDWRVLKYIFNKWRSVSERYGFVEYEAPIIEPVKLFTLKSGEEIKEQLFWFKDKGNRNVALRPELTPQLARYVIQYGKELKKPLKWFSIPRLFRYERPQKGRFREFFQYNADIVDSTTKSTAEVINLSINLLKSLGLTNKDFKIRINDRRIIDELIKKFKLKKEEFYKLLDKRYKMKESEFFKKLRKLNKSRELRKILKKNSLKDLSNNKQVKRVLELTDKDYVKFDLSIVRGLAYYTGIVFEAYDIKKELRAILGGGEYDNLVSDFGGPRIPCVGVGMGDAVLLELLKNKKLIPEFKKQGVFIATIGNVYKKAKELADELRQEQCVYLNNSDLNISKQLSLANDLGYQKVLIIGERGLKKKKITVKDMRSGKEEKISVKSVIKRLA